MTESFHTVELSDSRFERDGMRLVTVKSHALSGRTDVTVWVPEAEGVSTLLILLHGVYGSHWAWSLKGGVHQVAAQMIADGEIEPMVIAMPSDGLSRDGSGYLPRPHMDVEQFIVDEAPAIARLAAPALNEDARLGIAGLSMGGYGALRLGAKYAERFCAISAHSAITDLDDLASFVEEPLSDYCGCAPPEELTVLHWLRLHRDRLPPLRFDCGTEDSLLTSNRKLHQELRREEIPHDYAEYPGGHEWSYWQRHVAETLRHINQHCRKRGSR